MYGFFSIVKNVTTILNTLSTQRIMKKFVLLICVAFVSLMAYADRTYSFGQISCYSPQAGLVSGGGAVITVTIGDGYIIHSMYGKLYASSRNMDGSTTYLPSGYAGTPMAQLQGVMISANLQRLEEHILSSFSGMTAKMINTYTNAGEDGGRYANSWANAQAASRDRSHDSEIRREKRRNSGSCSRCHGTGVDPTCIDTSMPSSKAATSKIAAYTKCPYCHNTKSYDHWHWRCIECR